MESCLVSLFDTERETRDRQFGRNQVDSSSVRNRYVLVTNSYTDFGSKKCRNKQRESSYEADNKRQKVTAVQQRQAAASNQIGM